MTLRRLLITLVLSFANVVPIAGQEDPFARFKTEIVERTDRFEDQTTVDLKFLEVARGGDGRLYLSAHSAFASAAAERKPPSVLLTFGLFSTEGLHFPGTIFIYILVDNQRIPVDGTSRVIVEKTGDFFTEYAGINLDYDTFMKVLAGHKVEMRVDRTEFSLNDQQMGLLRDFGKRLRHEPPASGSSRSRKVNG